MTLVAYDDTVADLRTVNSYGSVAEADAYFALRLDTEAWDDPDNADKKEAALVSAVRLFERLPFGLLGEPAYPSASTDAAVTHGQVLQWPRTAPTEGDEEEAYDALPAAFQYASYEDGNERLMIPERIKQAQFEQALHLLANEGLLLADVQPAQISLGELSITNPGRISVISGLAADLLAPYIADAGVTSFAWGNDGYPLSATGVTDIDISAVANASTRR